MSKSTRKTVGVASAIVLSAVLVTAAHAAGGGQGAGCAEGRPAAARMGGHGHGHGHGQGRDMNMAQFADERLANAKESLAMTAEQEPLWSAFSDAVQGQVDTMQALREEHLPAKSEGQASAPTIEERIDAMETRADGMAQIATSARALYDSLSSEQKVAADQMLAQLWNRRN